MENEKISSNNEEIPKELNIFYRSLSSFIPQGKKWSDLTTEEKEEVKNKYRFSPLRPGLYQTITGIDNLL